MTGTTTLKPTICFRNALTAMFAGAILPAVAMAQAEYRAVIIEPWHQTYHLAISKVSGINNANVASGAATPDNFEGSSSFLWTLDGGKEVVNLAGAINDDGYVVGTSWMREPDGTLIELNGLGNADDLNNALVVVGDVTIRYWGGCRYTRYATVWDETNGTRSLETDFNLPAAHEARAINNANEVVGVLSSTGSCGDFEAYYLNVDTGEHIDIHGELLGGAMGLTEAYDINDDGVVVGDGPHQGEVKAFLWSRDGGFTFLPTLPGTLPSYSQPSSINNARAVVGQAIVNEEWRAWIWDAANGIRDLNELAEGLPDDFVMEEAKQINDNGWIIGRGHYGAWSPERAVVLVPLEMPGDVDGDGDVDMTDHALFTDCMTGPGGVHTPECAGADIDNDLDVDCEDHSLMSARM